MTSILQLFLYGTSLTSFFWSKERIQAFTNEEIGHLFEELRIELILGLLIFSMLAFLAGQIEKTTQQQNLKLSKDGQHVTFNIWDKKQTDKHEEHESNENKVKSTRYSLKWFLPSVLWEYCTDLGNVYFEIVVALQVGTTLSPTGKWSTLPGLLISFIGKVIMIAIEEVSLYIQDTRKNGLLYSKVFISKEISDQPLRDVKSGHIRAGDVILVRANETIPVDGPILASSENDGDVILVKEAALTGESSPAEKFSIQWNDGPKSSSLLDQLRSQSSLSDSSLPLTDLQLISRWGSYFARNWWNSKIEISAPSHQPNQFEGTLQNNDNSNDSETKKIQSVSFTPSQSVFRGTVLTGTRWILVLAVYTGSKTKLGQAFGRPPTKSTALDRSLSSLIQRWNFSLLAVCVFIASFWNRANGLGREIITNFLQLNGLNNLSTKLIGDVVRLSHSRQIASNPNLSVTANKYIPDALGTVDVMVMDKTGTLTRNKLHCLRFIDRDGRSLDLSTHQIEDEPIPLDPTAVRANKHSREILEIMALCNSVVPKQSQYFSSNPDDEEFVKCAARNGVVLVSRHRVSNFETSNNNNNNDKSETQQTQTSNSSDMVNLALMPFLFDDNKPQNKHYEVIGSHAFDSARKYMSVLVRDSETLELRLLVKGANRVVFDKLSQSEKHKVFGEDGTTEKNLALSEIIDKESGKGFRVLVWASRKVDENEFRKFVSLKNSTNLTKESEVESLWSTIEKDLDFLGATVVDDQLQEDVDIVLKYAKECGIKLVMATGDAVNTAVAIWTKLGQVSSEKNLHFITQQLKHGEKLTPSHLISESNQLLEKSKELKDHVLVVDGDAIVAISQQDPLVLDKLFTKIEWASIVAARVSALNKAQVVKIFRKSNQEVLAIGDGGNDVAMIQASSIGLGIVGKETEEAANASDFVLRKFKYVKHMLVLGLSSYQRLSLVYLWNDYKAVLLGMVPFLSRLLFHESLIPGDLIFALTTVDLAFPILFYGMYEQPFDEEEVLNDASLYRKLKHKLFSSKQKLSWWVSAVIHFLFVVFGVQWLWPLSTKSFLTKAIVGAQLLSILANAKVILMTVISRWRNSKKWTFRSFFDSLRSNSSFAIVFVSCAVAVLFFVPFARLNPLFDINVRQRLASLGPSPSSSLELPKLSGFDVWTMSGLAFVCLVVDMIVSYSFFL